jgi:hypothetical protein
MEVLCWAMAGPYFEMQKPLQTCTSCTQAGHCSPDQKSEMSMVCNDGMILAGKIRVWKQWAKFHLSLCVCSW